MATNYSGISNAYVLIGKESVYGTPVSATKDLGRIQSITPNLTNELIESRALSSRRLQALGTGNFRFSVDMEAEFQHGRIFEYGLGSVATTGAGAPYTHLHYILIILPYPTLALFC